jgi:hypothetical protein
MVTLYKRDAAVVAAILPLVVALRRARIGDEYGEAVGAVKNWEPPNLRPDDRETKSARIDDWLESIVSAIKDQL